MAMSDPETTAFVRDLMTDFAERTGLVGERAPTRYLWTDAFAVCNFLELERLDGLITCLELLHAANGLGEPAGPGLDRRIADLAVLAEGQPLATADPLGIGGLLNVAYTLAQLTQAGLAGYGDLLVSVLDEARSGLAYQMDDGDVLSMPAQSRLALRELGLFIGLRAVERAQALMERNPGAFVSLPDLGPRIERLRPYFPLIDAIERFWLEPRNRDSRTWKEHEDINAVMLATSLAPDGFLPM
jgi:hypothetical protein